MVQQKWLIALCAVSLFVCASSSLAQDTPGEVWVQLKGSDYAKPYFEGAEHEDHEFENNGYKLVIQLADYTSRVYEFTLKPSNPELAPVTFETNTKKFRRKKVGRRDYRMVMRVKAHFKKGVAEKKPVEKAPAKKAPAKKAPAKKAPAKKAPGGK